MGGAAFKGAGKYYGGERALSVHMIYSMVDDLNDGNYRGKSEQEVTVGEGKMYLFAEPHLRPCEFIEAAAEAHLA